MPSGTLLGGKADRSALTGLDQLERPPRPRPEQPAAILFRTYFFLFSLTRAALPTRLRR